MSMPRGRGLLQTPGPTAHHLTTSPGRLMAEDGSRRMQQSRASSSPSSSKQMSGNSSSPSCMWQVQACSLSMLVTSCDNYPFLSSMKARLSSSSFSFTEQSWISFKRARGRSGSNGLHRSRFGLPFNAFCGWCSRVRGRLGFGLCFSLGFRLCLSFRFGSWRILQRKVIIPANLTGTSASCNSQQAKSLGTIESLAFAFALGSSPSGMWQVHAQNHCGTEPRALAFFLALAGSCKGQKGPKRARAPSPLVESAFGAALLPGKSQPSFVGGNTHTHTHQQGSQGKLGPLCTPTSGGAP